MPPSTARPLPPLPEVEPAVVLDGGLRVVAANRRWRALHRLFADSTDIGTMVFCDHAASTFFVDRRHEEHDVVAALLDGARDEHARESALLAAQRLLRESGRFERLWCGPRIRQRLLDTYAVRDPDLGPLTFERRTVRRGGYLLRVAVPRPETSELLPLLDHLPD